MKFGVTLTMPIHTVRRLILAAMVLVVFSNIAYWVAEAWSAWAGMAWGLCAAGVAFFCRAKAGRMVQANKKYYFWLSIPAILALVPIILHIREAISEESASWWLRLWQLAPVLISFVIPVTLLWLAYSGLEGHLDSAGGSDT